MIQNRSIRRLAEILCLCILIMGFMGMPVSAEGEAMIPTAPVLRVMDYTSDSITLQWDLPDDSPDGAAGYLIYRSGKKDGKYRLLTELTVTGSTVKDLKHEKTIVYLVKPAVLGFTDENLKHGKTYYYKIAAYQVDASGQRTEGACSKAVSATTNYIPVKLSYTEVTASKVTLNWSEKKRAEKYEVYYSPKKKGNYKKYKSTAETSCIVTGLKEKKNYYFKVLAVGRSTAGKRIVSEDSKLVKVQTKPKVRKTAYVGDSVMSGLASYGVVKGNGKKVICKIGVNTYNFYNGSIMDTLLDYKPDRMYIMLGMNSLVGSPTNAQLNGLVDYYGKIIKECKRENKDIQIVMLSVSPTRSSQVKNSSVKKFNDKIKILAKKEKVYYYDYTDFLKDSDGRLNKKYAIEDGIHWNPSAYQIFKKRLDAYGKQLD